MKIQLPEKVNRIITTLQKHGFEAYAVGGCVRDSFLGRVPGDIGSAGRDKVIICQNF